MGLIPTRKDFIRAGIVGVVVFLPAMVVLTINRWWLMLPGWLAVVVALTSTSFGKTILNPVGKQLRWMWRLSQRGPIAWAYNWADARYVKYRRNYYGAKLDVTPLPPSALGTSVRGCEWVMLKWLPKTASRYSVDAFELQLQEVGEDDWTSIVSDFAGDRHSATTKADTAYVARVRARNSAGASPWVEHAFRTKQKPVGHGGVGAGYSWDQSDKSGELKLRFALPAGTRAKQLSVAPKPTSLAVKLDGSSLLEGELFGAIEPDETEWELTAAEGGGDGKVLALTLFKRAGTRSRDGPFWPCVVKGEPEIDVTGLKRHQKTMSELYEDPAMASLLHSMQMQQANAMDPMSEEMMGGMGLPTGPAWQ